jgi:2-polyprenyl-3-methyl-5-hydroxy-6-metoxy-1,4-benzoquinol methylase
MSALRNPTKCLCPLCGAQAADLLLQVERMPAHHVRPRGQADARSDYGDVEIAVCGLCGHLFNAAFDSGSAVDLYATQAPTNAPVSPAMLAAVQDIAGFIFEGRAKAAKVLEIGCGVGALARLMAERADRIDLIEPNLGLSTASFDDERIRFLPGFFPAASQGQRYDLIVCRQVLEHVDRPVEFLRAIRAHLEPEGEAYIEIPSADYIIDHASLVDFHYMHVQYFTASRFEQLFAGVGFCSVRSWKLKGGHDIGYVLRAATPNATKVHLSSSLAGLRERLATHRRAGDVRLRSLGNGIALYGACAYSQALLGLYPDISIPAAILDDTPGYRDHEVYSRTWSKRVVAPSPDTLNGVRHVIIASYLHDKTIAERLTAIGYSGSILTLRSDHQASRIVPLSLFALGERE